MYYVYILYSPIYDRYYIGQTKDFEGRLHRHNSKMEKSTAPFVPWEFVLKLSKPTRSEAMVLEKKLKNLNTEDLRKFISKYGNLWHPVASRLFPTSPSRPVRKLALYVIDLEGFNFICQTFLMV